VQRREQQNGEAAGFLSSPSAARTDFLKVLVFSGLTVFVLVISVFSPYLGLSALILLLVGFVLGINLRWGVLACVFLVPFDPQIELPSGIFLYLDLAFVALLWPFAWGVQSKKYCVNRASLWLVPFVVYAIATTFWRAEVPYWFWGVSVRWVISLIFAAVVSSVAEGEDAILALGLSLAPICLYGYYQLLIEQNGWLYTVLNPHFEEFAWGGRASSLFQTWNGYGNFCAVAAVMVLALATRSENRVRRTLYMALAGVGFVGLLSSGSRGALLGAGVALLLLLVIGRSNRPIRFILAIAGLCGVLAVVTLNLLPLERIGVLDDDTIQGRLTLYEAALLLFSQHPVIGVGLTNFGQLLPRVIVWNYENLAAHNTYLQVLAENGVIGFLLFFIPLFYLLYRNFRAAQKSIVALACTLGLSVILVHGLTDYFLGGSQNTSMFAVVFGLASKCVLTPAALRVPR
jgi:putative inorganic carbon (HCO3(-)) transporter